MMRKTLRGDFFNKEPTIVAKELLGKFLVRKFEGMEKSLLITEVEAYGGSEDLASHARHGRTKRNEAMFGPPGIIYVYFTYGMHWMLNIVCCQEGHPSAVLIRSAVPFIGPARLTKALEINKTLNMKQLRKKNGLWIEDRGIVIAPRQIKKTPRVGVAYAWRWAEKRWRFVIDANHHDPGTVRDDRIHGGGRILRDHQTGSRKSAHQ